MKRLHETKQFIYHGLDLQVRADHNWIVTDSTGYIKTSKAYFEPNERNGIWVSTDKDSNDPVTFICKVDLEGVNWKETAMPLRKSYISRSDVSSSEQPQPKSSDEQLAAVSEPTLTELFEKAFHILLNEGLLIENVEYRYYSNSAFGSGREQILLQKVEVNTRTLEKA